MNKNVMVFKLRRVRWVNVYEVLFFFVQCLLCSNFINIIMHPVRLEVGYYYFPL